MPHPHEDIAAILASPYLKRPICSAIMVGAAGGQTNCSIPICDRLENYKLWIGIAAPRHKEVAFRDPDFGSKSIGFPQCWTAAAITWLEWSLVAFPRIGPVIAASIYQFVSLWYSHTG